MSVPGSNARPDWPLAVVIGAGGLGMAVARRLGQSHRLIIADRDAAHLDQQIERLAEAGHDATGVGCDVTNPDDLEQLAAQSGAAGGVRSLAYVVGLSPSLGDFRTIMSVNLVGAARTVAFFADHMVTGGAALCIASSAAHMQRVPDALLSILDDPLGDDLIRDLELALAKEATPAKAYVLSKLAVIRLCQITAPLWGQRGQRIVSLSPGLIATPQGAGEYAASPGKMKLFEATPLSRESTMLEIADVADFLLSDRAAYVTGIDLLVDGGLIAGLGCRSFV